MRSHVFLVAVLTLAQTPARGDTPAALGKIDFPVTGGTPEARQHFERGLLAIHSFWYDEAKAEMNAAVKADPTFAMGWWGVAMSHSRIFWHYDELPASREALAKITAPDKLTPRERAWIEAARALFADGNTLSRRQGFTAVLEKMHRDFPQDDEVTTFYAVGLLSSRGPQDPEELANRARAASLAMEVFARNPRHPGAAHYIIHALDTPDLAPLALAAARQYASIAPEAFHARHMPAHIFSRLGMWKEALASCQSAWEASVASSERAKLGTNGHDFHSLDWIMEIDFQLGRRKDADASLSTFAEAVRSGMNRSWRRMYTQEVSSWLSETEAYDRVDQLLAPLSSPVVDPKEGGGGQHCASPAIDLENPPLDVLEQGSVLEVRIEAAARRRDLAATRRHLAEYEKVLAQLRPYDEHDLGKEELARREKMRAGDREIVLARARGDDKAVLAGLRKQAESLDKRPLGEWAIFYGGVHEDIGETLLRLGRAKEALAEYQLVLRKHHYYARGLLGAARAAAKAGDSAAARGYYSQVLDVWSSADPDFPGLEEAKRAVGAAQK